MFSIPYLISSLLVAEDNAVAINTIFELISPHDIGKEYGALYSMLIESWKRHKLIEPVAIYTEIMAKYPEPKHHNKLIEQLHNVWGLVLYDRYWQHYLKLSLLEIKVNKLKEKGKQITDSNLSTKEIDAILQDAKTDISHIIDKFQMMQKRDIAAITDEYVSAMDAAISNDEAGIIRTGLYYESKIRGFRPGDYIILAGRPKMGKSAVANSIIVSALQSGKRVMVVNNEMDELQVINRLISRLYDIPFELLQNPKEMGESQISHLMSVSDEFRKLKLNLYCFQFKTPSEIETEAKRLSDAGTPIDFLVIDYIQLFKPNEKKQSRYDEITSLSWEIKMLAADLRIPVLALAQVNRKCEERPNKRPLPADLRESGSLEQDATAVMFIYRDEVYHENTSEPGIAEINVAINRNGKTGVDKYYIDFDHMRIANLEMRGDK